MLFVFPRATHLFSESSAHLSGAASPRAGVQRDGYADSSRGQAILAMTPRPKMWHSSADTRREEAPFGG